MDLSFEKIEDITGNNKIVGDDWMPATGTRNLLLDDPCLIWLQFHGSDFGFEKDTEDKYSLSDFIMSAGRDFEGAWIKNVAPEGAQALRDDRDVRRVQGLLRTVELMQLRTPVITHAALWNAKAKIYGAADIICLTSWLYDKFPHLAPAKKEVDHYVVIDLKMTSGLHKSEKAKSLAAYSSQVRLYSYMLGHITGYMPARAYLVTKDRFDDPIPIEVTSKLGKPLDSDLSELRDRFLDIKTHGANYKPWQDDIVKPNFSNSLNAPWAGAVQKIATEYVTGRPVEWLPRIGHSQADALKLLGFSTLDDMLSADPDKIPLESVDGIGDGTARQIRAVLRANKSHKITQVPPSIVPKKRKLEFYVDYEFFPNLKCRYDEERWPDCLSGREMIFLIGCGWNDSSDKWHYQQFTAQKEDYASEKKMFEEFLDFLKTKKVFDKDSDAVLWHYSQAEVWQSARAAKRTELPDLGKLPWEDLQHIVLDLPLGVPGAWGFGLKSVAKAITEEEPEFGVKWPSGLGNGAAASVVGWRMYESTEPLKTVEYDLLTQYLEADCHSLERVLSWLRSSAKKEGKSRVEPAKRKAAYLRSSGTHGWYPSGLELVRLF